jgi:hypothetical protein
MKPLERWLWFIIGLILALIMLVCSKTPAAVITTYAKKYSDSARVHHNRRYHPDSMNVASGWRELFGQTLWIEAPAEHLTLVDNHGRKIRLERDARWVIVRVKDVMNIQYDNPDSNLHIDASPAVMKALGLKHRSTVTVLIDIAPLRKKKVSYERETMPVLLISSRRKARLSPMFLGIGHGAITQGAPSPVRTEFSRGQAIQHSKRRPLSTRRTDEHSFEGLINEKLGGSGRAKIVPR